MCLSDTSASSSDAFLELLRETIAETMGVPASYIQLQAAPDESIQCGRRRLQMIDGAPVFVESGAAEGGQVPRRLQAGGGVKIEYVVVIPPSSISQGKPAGDVASDAVNAMQNTLPATITEGLNTKLVESKDENLKQVDMSVEGLSKPMVALTTVNPSSLKAVNPDPETEADGFMIDTTFIIILAAAVVLCSICEGYSLYWCCFKPPAVEKTKEFEELRKDLDELRAASRANEALPAPPPMDSLQNSDLGKLPQLPPMVSPVSRARVTPRESPAVSARPSARTQVTKVRSPQGASSSAPLNVTVRVRGKGDAKDWVTYNVDGTMVLPGQNPLDESGGLSRPAASSSGLQ